MDFSLNALAWGVIGFMVGVVVERVLRKMGHH